MLCMLQGSRAVALGGGQRGWGLSIWLCLRMTQAWWFQWFIRASNSLSSPRHSLALVVLEFSSQHSLRKFQFSGYTQLVYTRPTWWLTNSSLCCIHCCCAYDVWVLAFWKRSWSWNMANWIIIHLHEFYLYHCASQSIFWAVTKKHNVVFHFFLAHVLFA